MFKTTTVAAVAILCLAGCASAVAQDAPSFDPQARVSEALEQIKPIAYHRDRLDWPAIEARARRLAEGARDEVDLMPAYQALVTYLDDNHSFVVYPDGLIPRWRERHGDRRMLPNPPPSPPPPTSLFMRRTEPEVTLAALGPKQIAIIVVPAVASSGEPPSAYGARLHGGVRAIQDQVCGYVVDLRGNTGGDMFPMVIGLSDLVGDGSRIVFVKPDGTEMVAVLRDGAIRAQLEDGSEFLLDRIEGWRHAPGVDARPVAVLIDDATASSGEGTALALIGRESVRTFGGRTAGRASANEMIALSDGTRLFITVAMMTDRLGRTYPQGIPPDAEAPAGDATQSAALSWLSAQKACAA